jgi:4-amino-4-deoxy-L-arabinose transferase-like glycosyltransferase
MKKKKVDSGGQFQNGRAFFALGTVLVVMIGQIILSATPIKPEVALPVSAWLCFAGVVLFVISQAFRPPRFLTAFFARLRFPHTLAWVMVAIVLSVLATFSSLLYVEVGRVNFISVVALWLAAAASYIAAFSKGILVDFQWREWLSSHRNELIAIGLVTLLGAVLRFYRLGQIPPVINGDEGKLGLMAQSTFQGPLTNPFALWDNIGALYLQAINLVFKLIGPTVFSLRLLPAIGGVLTIPSLYLFARQLAGKRTALLAAILVALSHTHINFSRTASADYIHTTWLLPLVLYFLLSGLDKRAHWRMAAAGVLLAIYFTVFLTAQIAVIVVLVFSLIVCLIHRSRIREVLGLLLVFWAGFLILFLPEAVDIGQHPHEFIARLGVAGTFQTGWLAETMASTGHSVFQLLVERVVHAFLSLIYYPALDFYGTSTPMLTIITGSLFLIGVGLSLWRTRSTGYLLLNGYFWGFTLAFAIFAIPPSADSFRMLNVLPAALLMAGLGLDQILEAVGLGWNRSRLGYTLTAAIILVSVLAINLWTYFGDFAGRCLYADDLPGRFASYLGNYAYTLKPEVRIYLLSNGDYFYGSHLSVDFLSQGRQVVNVDDPVDSLAATAGEVIVANPDRFKELTTWAAAHPGGDLHYVYDCKKIIMIAYQFP